MCSNMKTEMNGAYKQIKASLLKKNNYSDEKL